MSNKRHTAVNEREEDDQQMEVDDDDDELEEGGIRIGDIYLPPPPPPACTFDSTGPRLIITHIENEFFKSYAGSQVLGPFHKSFTSIVGPNGSGKSNVIDSMLFVFGYRAQKIRSKKISVLIHNSDAYPNVQSCSVSVHFQKVIDKGDDYEVVPNSHFVISRTAFKDNSSYYQINGKRCQFKAVSKLLREYGIDLDHNRFLILQGEVEQIALMKPKGQSETDTGMLEYLESIVGSNRLKEPIELLSKRVEALNEQRTEKLNRVKLVEKEKDELEGPKNEALGYIKLENELAVTSNKIYQIQIMQANMAKEEAEKKRNEIDESMKSIREKLAELEAVKHEKGEKKKCLEEILDKINKDKEQNSEAFKVLETEDAKIGEELQHKNQKRKKLIAQLKSEKEKLDTLEKIPQKNESDILECKNLKEDLEKTCKKEEEEYHKVIATLNNETQKLQDEKVKFETQLVDLRKVVDETKSALDIAQSELDIYLSTEKNEKNRLFQMKQDKEKSEGVIMCRKDELTALSKEIPRLESQLGKERDQLQKLCIELQNKEEMLKTSRLKLEETRSAMHSSRSRGRVLDAIMEQKHSARIPGIYGRLGDLGGIDGKYDVAISTACGPLDNVVVDTVETGQACIGFLKRNNIGTATFIALDKMEKWRPYTEKTIQTPENVPRLFDLVTISDRDVKTAFYFALRDTLVAKDLDQATRIAYGKVRHRVVTLKGELIEPSGTMSGGGKCTLKGRMGKAATVCNVDPHEVSRTESLVDSLTTEVSAVRRQVAELEDSVHRKAEDLKLLTVNQKKYTMEVEAAKERLKTLDTQIREQETKVKSVEANVTKVKEMEKNVSLKQKSYEQAAVGARGVEEEINKIHKQIDEITSGKTKSLKKKINDTKKKLEKVNDEINRLQVAIKTAKRNFKKTEEKITSLEAEIKESETDLLEMKDRKTKIEEEAAALIAEIQQITDQESQVEVELIEIKGHYEAIVKKENKIKASKIEVTQELEKYESVIKEKKELISATKRKVSKLELGEVPLEKDETQKMELKTYEKEELEAMDKAALNAQVEIIKQKLSQAKPNLAVLQEYKKKEEVYLQRVGELDEVTNQRDEQRKYHDDLRKQRLNEFMSGFTIISNKLKEMYQMITLGGDAELELVDSLDPFSEGIVFSVRPPKKSWKNITNLSGGEKTLSSLALVFALHYYKPTPLYVMDEIDAALDFKNVSIVGNYVKDRTKNAQFVIISLRSQMFELADRLVGIYKTYNTTKSVTINPHYYTKLPKDSKESNTPPAGEGLVPLSSEPVTAVSTK